MKIKLFLALLLLGRLTFSQTQIGTDINGEAADNLSGCSVSLSADGSVVAIAARLNDGVNGTDSGHVRIYENTLGVWTQVGADIDGEAAGDRLDIVSLSADGNIVAIGAYLNDGANGLGSGHVRIFENISGTWTQIGADIDGEAQGDSSGSSVSLNSDGSIVAIGATNNDSNGIDSGHVRIYENISGTWTQIGVDIDGEATGNGSGYSVSLSADGSIVAIGAPFNEGVNGLSSGHVRIYENVSGTWTQIGADIDGEAINDLSGYSVSLGADGSIVAIAARFNDGNGTNSGHVRVFENISGVWTQIGADIDGETSNDESGWSLDINTDGNIVAIGSIENDGNGNISGHVRIFKNQSSTWSQIGTDIDGEISPDQSGYSVSLNSDGSIIAIGAVLNSGTFGFASGHVRVFDLSSVLSVENHTFGTEFNVYPNPSNGFSKINLGETYNQVNVQIVDILGKLVSTQSYSDTDTVMLNTQEYATGIYFIKVQSGTKRATIKLVVK